MVKSIPFALAFLFSPYAWGSELPDPKVWAQEISDEVWLATPGLIRNFTILAGKDSKQKKWSAIGSEVSHLGFLQYFDPS
ncbi:MAG: hypothetical protein M3Q07_23935, partial [Pseudobdellovibrionaceae bacterium]|nr:hypothetical protein [Pseudobdellovibrionaceae bacterium]